MASKIIRKTLEEAQGLQRAEIDFSEKSLVHLEEMPRLWTMMNVTRLTLAHNKIAEIPTAMANLENLEILNMFNNNLEEVPVALSGMPKLRILNLAMNRLSRLPRGFGSFPMLEVLDLSYNNLNEGELPGSFWTIHSLRALYLSDNELEVLSPDIRNLTNLRILALRDNELVEVPQEIGELQNLRELHLQGNRLTVLPPQIGQLDFLSSRSILKLDNNPWVPPIEDQLVLGVSHVIEYIRTETYKYLFSRHITANVPPPEKSDKANKKLTRKSSRASLNGSLKG
jgi:Leucine-rich repeat (LRR) protein